MGCFFSYGLLGMAIGRYTLLLSLLRTDVPSDEINNLQRSHWQFSARSEYGRGPGFVKKLVVLGTEQVFTQLGVMHTKFEL